MKLTKIILFSAMLCLSANIFAKENTRRGWQLDLQRLGLNLSSTNVTHAEDYGAFADARLTANNQTTVQGELNFKAEYFGKFYNDGGKPFTPLSINTKYVNVVK